VKLSKWNSDEKKNNKNKQENRNNNQNKTMTGIFSCEAAAEKNEIRKNCCQSGRNAKILEVTKRFSFSLTFGLLGVCLLLKKL